MGHRELLAGITVEGESNGLQTFFLSNFFLQEDCSSPGR
jgi:hypothetical protein